MGKINDECEKIPEKKSKQRHIECNSDCDHTIQKVNKDQKLVYFEILKKEILKCVIRDEKNVYLVYA